MFAYVITDKIAEVGIYTVAGTTLGSALILYVLGRKVVMRMVKKKEEEEGWDKKWKDNEWKLEKAEYKEDLEDSDVPY